MKHLCIEVRKCRLEDTLIDRLKPTLTSFHKRRSSKRRNKATRRLIAFITFNCSLIHSLKPQYQFQKQFNVISRGSMKQTTKKLLKPNSIALFFSHLNTKNALQRSMWPEARK